MTQTKSALPLPYQRGSTITIEKLFVKGNEAFVRYECETKAGSKFRNTEYVRVKGDKIDRVEVYYGSLPTEI